MIFNSVAFCFASSNFAISFISSEQMSFRATLVEVSCRHLDKSWLIHYHKLCLVSMQECKNYIVTRRSIHLIWFLNKNSMLDLFTIPFLYLRIFLWAMMIYQDNWTLCHINSWSLLQPVASITRHIDGDIALTNDDEDNNGNAFFRKGYIPAAMYSSLLCMRDLFFWYFFFQNDCQFYRSR